MSSLLEFKVVPVDGSGLDVVRDEAGCVVRCTEPCGLRDFWEGFVTKASWFTPCKETLVVIAMDNRLTVTGFTMVSVGSIDQTIALPREVIMPVLLSGAAKFALMHNHPSGDLDPSVNDRKLTRRMAEVATLVGIDLSDHVIVGSRPGCDYCSEESGYFSFHEHGLI